MTAPRKGSGGCLQNKAPTTTARKRRAGYRTCQKCGRNRADRFFVGTRGRTCQTCRRRRTKRQARAPRLLESYDITLADYDALFQAQGGKCAICGGVRSGNLDVDHSHRLEKAGAPKRRTVRGLLCRRCNRRLLPACLDNELILLRAVRYLRRPPAQRVLEGS